MQHPQPGRRREMVALPVSVEGPRHLVEQVGAWVESHLGWQVTDGDELPASLRLVGVSVESRATDANRAVGAADGPSIALVGPDDDPVRVGRLARRVDAVLAWPRDHDRLADLAGGLLDVSPRPGVEGIRIGGAAGGVGTTTLALALGGLVAWSGSRCLVVARGDVPVAGVRRVASEVLAGHRAWAAAVEVGDVPGLRVVGVDQPVRLAAPPSDVRLVHDCGVDVSVDVLVVRRDRAGLAAIERSGAALVVVSDLGPRTLVEVVEVAAGRQVVVVPWSVRVARLHDARRLPAALPGAFLDPLRTVLDLVTG